MKKRNKKLAKRAALAGLFCLIAAAALIGCKRGVAMMSEVKTEKGYTLPQIQIIASTEKNRYDAVCGSQLWGVTVQLSSGEKKVSGLERDHIKSFMEQMKIMTLLAKKKKVELTSEERSAMQKASDEYYHALSKDDIKAMGVSLEDVQTVFEDYRLANKLMDVLTKDMNLEVSDSEAKMITVEEVKTDQKTKAEQVAQAAAQEGANFQSCAADAGLTVKTRLLGRAEENKAYEDAAFALTAGQVSGVIEADGAYYVLKCDNDYDEKATEARKEKIYLERKWRAFRDIYDKFKEGIKLTYTGDPWQELDLTRENVAKNADFFEIYKKYE